MSRYGWSTGRDQISPYASISDHAPAVTDDDYSYITSQDLDDVADTQYYSRHSGAAQAPEDDVLLIKNKGVTYPAHFPAYAIGDGKLKVKDVRERVALMMEVPDRDTRRIKLFYKGRQLKDHLAPARDYGVKNKSELMAVIPEIEEGSSPSEEEMVIVDAPREGPKKKKGKKKKGKKKGDGGDGSSIASSNPRDSTSTFEVPKSPPPPQRTPQPAQPAQPAAASGPIKQLDDLSLEFSTKWIPLCNEFVAAPPADAKKREDEHRKLSETVMQHILLKLDDVDSQGVAEIRARRKALIQEVQATMKRLDIARDSV